MLLNITNKNRLTEEALIAETPGRVPGVLTNTHNDMKTLNLFKVAEILLTIAVIGYFVFLTVQTLV